MFRDEMGQKKKNVKSPTKIPLSKCHFSFKRVAIFYALIFFSFHRHFYFESSSKDVIVTVIVSVQYWRVYSVINFDIKHTGAFLMTLVGKEKK